LTSAYEDQTLRLSDSALDAETAEVRERVRADNVRVRRHDLINAITAIDGAAMILEREFDRLSDGDRETLAQVLGSGTDRLRRLVSQESGSGAHVSMAEAAAIVARDPTWRTGLELDVTPDLVATGSAGETAVALHQLVEYARRRAPGSPVTLRGERDGEWVVLRVEDRGPAMSRELRRTLTDSGAGYVAGREDAVNLRLAARLMRGQGGDLWVESRPGGGASFGICLPAVLADGDHLGADA
jgi:signal transduction histidine kinase